MLMKKNIIKYIFKKYFIPGFGIPLRLGSEKGTHSVSAVVQELCKPLGIQQLSGKDERYNGILRNRVSKIRSELDLTGLTSYP